jgi:hypothetical protein
MALRTPYSDALEALAMNDADVMRLLHEVYHLRRSIAALSAHAIRLRALVSMLESVFSRSR